jgi:hypothetical protein
LPLIEELRQLLFAHCPAASLTNRMHSHGAVPGTEAVRQGAETIEVEIAVSRIYAMKPRMD